MTNQDDLHELARANAIETAEHEARAYAAYLAAHGYDEASVWHYSVALDNYDSRRQSVAAGFAVRYAGTLVRDDGSRAEHPAAGITVFCQDTQLAAGNLIRAGRALVAFGDGSGDWRAFSGYTPYYVASWNDRDTDLRRDQNVNPGELPYVLLHELTPMIGNDGPKRFYDLRLEPAGDLATGTRVRVVSGSYEGLAGVITHPHVLHPVIQVDPPADHDPAETARRGYLRQVDRADLAAGDTCSAGHPLRWSDSYDPPRWVHINVADLVTCPHMGELDQGGWLPEPGTG